MDIWIAISLFWMLAFFVSSISLLAMLGKLSVRNQELQREQQRIMRQYECDCQQGNSWIAMQNCSIHELQQQNIQLKAQLDMYGQWHQQDVNDADWWKNENQSNED